MPLGYDSLNDSKCVRYVPSLYSLGDAHVLCQVREPDSLGQDQSSHLGEVSFPCPVVWVGWYSCTTSNMAWPRPYVPAFFFFFSHPPALAASVHDVFLCYFILTLLVHILPWFRHKDGVRDAHPSQEGKKRDQTHARRLKRGGSCCTHCTPVSPPVPKRPPGGGQICSCFPANVRFVASMQVGG